MAVARRRVDIDEGKAALEAWREAGRPPSDVSVPVPRTVIATAVRYSLEEVTARAPGNSVEVRVPPFGVTQCVEGPRHTRGTPPNVIGLGFIRELVGVEISFFRWMTIGVPIVAVLFMVMFGYLNALCPAGVRFVQNLHDSLSIGAARLRLEGQA